ncbi:uncharacterized protein BDZ83DRAFT_583536 [Colletotrichum acutatum]|uniref:Uncharacterized protein n=1 Tax=Glomerella acutata TaxID=27357 RepID=A0AAD8UIR6_GLOAC|nr:uncharacterized protein BDZ83DRAFT_583536 [Colletotrichum acutatum]KAK1721460.1 hypothetical protein BDZ83DRAFT_583536 [Colletotrichum acutatum]
MVHLVSAAAVLALSAGLGLSPATALVSAEPISAPRPPYHQPPPLTPSSSVDFAPSADHARENAVHIFNAVHSAMRQWGSSLHHNGLGLIPATVPKGTLMYHGTRSNSTPDSFEWLAFEMEHSEGFARSFRGGRGSPPPRPPGKGKGPGGPPGSGGGGPPEGPHGSEPILMIGGEGSQRPIVADDDDDDDDDRQKPPPRGPSGPGGGDGKPVRGYFHTYRAKRDLKLLYLDGMAAGKTGMGTLDTQDFLLRGLKEAPGFGEWDRAADICDVVKAWGLDGVIRMEIGFEAIYCDFHDGLALESVLRRPWNDVPEAGGGIDMFEWARAVGQRYDGIGGGRVRLGFGGMVSGLWYPLNVSNPNGRVDMPRLGRLTEGERGVMLGRVGEIVKGARWKDGRVDWQGVVDMIVTRHGDRIETLADEGADGGDEGFVAQVLTVTNTFVDYPRDADDSTAISKKEEEDEYVREARERCVRHFLTSATVWRAEWTPEDGMVYVAVEAVVQRLCGDLFDVRGLVLQAMPALAGADSEAEVRRIVDDKAHGHANDDDDKKLEGAVTKGRKLIQALKEDLGWSTWKKCRPGCDVGEICFIAMWPFGLKEDHFHPSCHNRSSLAGRDGRRGAGKGYWEWEPRP